MHGQNRTKGKETTHHITRQVNEEKMEVYSSHPTRKGSLSVLLSQRVPSSTAAATSKASSRHMLYLHHHGVATAYVSSVLCDLSAA